MSNLNLGYRIGTILGKAYVAVRRNPVLVGAAALWGYETLTAGDALTWQGVVTVAVGVLVRAKVVPASEVVEVIDDIEGAFQEWLDAAEDGLDEDEPED
jgi:hypothetical protein